MNRERCNEKAQASQCRFQAETEAECLSFLERFAEVGMEIEKHVLPIAKPERKYNHNLEPF